MTTTRTTTRTTDTHHDIFRRIVSVAISPKGLVCIERGDL
jgi:hypothetical protein